MSSVKKKARELAVEWENAGVKVDGQKYAVKTPTNKLTREVRRANRIAIKYDRELSKLQEQLRDDDITDQAYDEVFDRIEEITTDLEENLAQTATLILADKQGNAPDKDAIEDELHSGALQQLMTRFVGQDDAEPDPTGTPTTTTTS